MNRYVADPDWHGYIIAYFYLGGIAAGAYATACLAAFFGTEEDRRATRSAYYLAFPIVNLCGLLLVIDLGRPERFYHMLVASRTWMPMLKWWSPMSAGSWGLSIFGAFSFLSFLGVLAEDGRLGLARWAGPASHLARGWFGALFQVGGALSGFFLGAYTGSLLGATNQPIWADTTWLSPLFLASAASTGIAAMLLVGPRLGGPPHSESIHRLERLDRVAMALELVLIAAFMISLREFAEGAFLTWPGVLVPAFVVPIGVVGPWLISRFAGPRGIAISAAMALIGGFALRYAVVMMPGPWLVGHS